MLPLDPQPLLRYLRATTRAAARLGSLLDVDRVLDAVVETLVTDFDAALARVWLYDDVTHTLHLRASAGLSRRTADSPRARIDIFDYPHKVGEVARTRQPFIKNGLADDPQFEQGWVAREGIAAVASFPLLAGDRLQGVLVHFHRRPLGEEIIEAMTAFAAIVTASLNDARRYRELRETDRHKDEMLSMLAHELRNPLAPIHHALHLLDMPNVGPEDAALARRVLGRQVEHLTRLVNDLLDVSRLTRGKVELRKEPLDLLTAVSRAVETARPLVEARRHELVVSFPDRPMRLEADPDRLHQVLANLLDNAVKYTEPGGRITLNAVPVGPDVELRVRDTGVGMKPELLARVFDLFTQAERSLDRSEGGLGIGLTLVRRLVELHGGSVRATSAGPGLGSEFVICLPALPELRPEPSGDTRAQRPARGHSRRILVVDDNRDVAESLGMVLRCWGHDVHLAHDGPEALAAAHTVHPDAILLDIGLPGMDGYEVARRLRQDGSAADTLLIAVTGYGQDEYCRRSLEAGFRHHLVKPVNLAELSQLLQ